MLDRSATMATPDYLVRAPTFVELKNASSTELGSAFNTWYSGCSLMKKKLLTRPFATEEQLAAEAESAPNIEEVRGRLRVKVPNFHQGLINPEGKFRKVWDALMGLLIFVDAFTAPVLIAYFYYINSCDGGVFSHSYEVDPEQPAHVVPLGLIVVQEVINIGFWIDLFLNFMTGVPDQRAKGKVDYNPLHIVRSYLTSWFIIDFVSCMPWACIIAPSSSVTPELYTITLLLGMLRMVGLRRRAHGSPLRWVDYIDNSFSFAIRRVLVLTLFAAGIGHWFACAAWWVARHKNFPGLDGVSPNNSNSSAVWPVELNLVYNTNAASQYLWSYLCTVSVAIMNTYGPFPPVTVQEAMLWEVQMFIMAFMFLLLMGVLVATLYGPGNPSHAYVEFLDDKLNAMHEHGVDVQTQRHVLKHIRMELGGRRIEDEKQLLAEIPYHIASSIATALYGESLRQFPLFAGAPDMVVEALAMRIIKTVVLQGDFIIRHSYPLRYMYFLVEGSIGISVLEGDEDGYDHSVLEQHRFSHLEDAVEEEPEIEALHGSHPGHKQKLSNWAQKLLQGQQQQLQRPRRMSKESDLHATDHADRNGCSKGGAGSRAAGKGNIAAAAARAKRVPHVALSMTNFSKSDISVASSSARSISKTSSSMSTSEIAASLADSCFITIGPGQWFGTAALFGNPPNSFLGDDARHAYNSSPFSAVALAPCRLLALSYDNVSPIIKRTPELRRKVAMQAERYWDGLQHMQQVVRHADGGVQGPAQRLASLHSASKQSMGSRQSGDATSDGSSSSGSRLNSLLHRVGSGWGF